MTSVVEFALSGTIDSGSSHAMIAAANSSAKAALSLVVSNPTPVCLPKSFARPTQGTAQRRTLRKLARAEPEDVALKYQKSLSL